MNKNWMNGFLDKWVEASTKKRAASILPAVLLATNAFFFRQDADSTLVVAFIHSSTNPFIRPASHFR
ncbi:MAG: hypothetical protein ABSF34_13965 [Verrucomicrobiota bacterium]|jgi:hypothetical protein